MSENIFFKKKGPYSIKKLIEICDGKILTKFDQSIKIQNISDLPRADNKDITFLNSAKYKGESLKSKAKVCITSKDLAKYLPESCLKIIVNNVFLAVAKITKLFYPNADFDYLDKTLVLSEKLKSLNTELILTVTVSSGSRLDCP